VGQDHAHNRGVAPLGGGAEGEVEFETFSAPGNRRRRRSKLTLAL